MMGLTLWKRIVGTVVAAVVAVFALEMCVAAGDGEQSLEWTLYGGVHVSAEILDDGEESDEYLSSNKSRLGFKGSSTLGEGPLKAIWQIETTVKLDESGTELATRNSFAGLSGPFGTVLGGRHDTPLKSLARKADMMGDRLADSRNIIGQAGAGYDLRPNNVLMYKSPVWCGLTAAAAYSLDDGDGDTSVASGTVMYKADGLLLGLGYEKHGKMLTAVDTDGDGETDAPSDRSEAACRAVAKYQWDEFAVSALYEGILDGGGVSGADRKSWGIGGSYALGDFVFRGQYYSTGGVDGVPDAGAYMLGGAVDWIVGERTVLYVACATTANESAATHRMTGGAHGQKVTPAAGNDPSGVACGVIHSF